MRTFLMLIACMFGSAAVAEDYVTIKGQVKWNGKAPPALVPVNVTVFPPVIVMPTDIVVDAKTLGFKNVIVWLRPDSDDRKETFPADKIKPELRKPASREYIIDSIDLQFEPRVLAARVGDTLKFLNTSERTINVNYSSDAETANPLIKPDGEFKLKNPLAAQSTPISLSCNVHPWMGGRIWVFDHPYYALADKDGNFEIKDAPTGKWRIVYSHEYGYHQGRKGLLGFPIDVKADKPNGTTMEMKPLPFEIVQPKP